MKNKKPIPDFSEEIRFGYPRSIVAGVDEVGRGCIAGPVVGAAVILPPSFFTTPPSWLSEVRDSKLLTEKTRVRLSLEIQKESVSYSIQSADVQEIEKLNILWASQVALLRSLEGLPKKPDHVLVDGNILLRDYSGKQSFLIQGDQKSLSIACASILAKVFRDEWMKKIDIDHPEYGFSSHKGYGTKKHIDAIKKHGVLSHHRMAFEPMKSMSLS